MENKVMREHMNSRLKNVDNVCIHPSMPRSLNVELNNTCNHKCLYCQYHGPYGTHIPKPAVMAPELAKNIIKQASELGAGQHELGLYMSGEPFLYPELADIIKYAKDRGFPYVFLTTNGAFATPDKIAGVLNAGLDSIRFSINASDREHYEYFHGRDDFEIVTENLKCMSNYIKNNNIKVATSISVVVTALTPNIRQEMKDLYSKYVDDIVFFPVILDGLNVDENLKKKLMVLETPKEPIENYVCSYPFNSMYIDAAGLVRPCCHMFGENDEAWDMTKECDLEKAWNSMVMIKYRRLFAEKLPLEGSECKNCFLRFQPTILEA